MTQQDQGPSGHRRAFSTTKVVAKFGATLGCNGCFDLGPHTEACRARLEKAVVDHKMGAGVLGARVGPIAEESKASEEKEACDARTGEKLDQEEVWKERAKMV